jgi:hypothetical protein
MQIIIDVDVEAKKINSVMGMDGIDPLQASIILQQVSLKCLTQVKVMPKGGDIEVVKPQIKLN